MQIVAILPALNEQETVAPVVAGLLAHVARVIVVDNGSTDATAERAREAGATVVYQSERGYGAACLAGAEAAKDADALLFMDADGSDDPDDVPRVVAALTEDVGIVLGVRPAHLREPGAMTSVQEFGNWFAPFLLRRLSRARYSDLPPFKLVRRSTFESLGIRDRQHGFTIQLLLRAHSQGVRVQEVPVNCRARRGGVSKVSGTVVGSLRAGTKILTTVATHVVRERFASR
jgi:glycosyltransferase involved in cell wall biosynthesis